MESTRDNDPVARPEHFLVDPFPSELNQVAPLDVVGVARVGANPEHDVRVRKEDVLERALDGDCLLAQDVAVGMMGEERGAAQ